MDEEQKPKKYVNVNEIALECDFLKREKNSSFEIHFNEIARLRVFLFGDQTKDFGYHGRIKKVASSPAYEDMMILKEINHYMNYTTSLWQSYDELKKRYDTYLKRALDLIDNAIELLRKKESEEKKPNIPYELIKQDVENWYNQAKKEGKDIFNSLSKRLDYKQREENNLVYLSYKRAYDELIKREDIKPSFKPKMKEE